MLIAYACQDLTIFATGQQLQVISYIEKCGLNPSNGVAM